MKPVATLFPVLCLVFAGICTAENVKVFEIGSWNDDWREFGRYAHVMEFKGKPCEVDAVTVENSMFPMFISGPADGNPNSANPLNLHFSLTGKVSDLHLTIVIYGTTSYSLETALKLNVNGKSLGEERWRATPASPEVEYEKYQRLIRRRISAGWLSHGRNTISIEVVEGHYVTFDYLALTESPIDRELSPQPWWEQQHDRRGRYFAKKEYVPEPIPALAANRDRIPRPVFDERPDWLRCYWKAWELAFDRFRKPRPGSPFVSNYMDEAFADYALWLWDTSFMTMFGNYAHHIFPGIRSLDNFYCNQYPDGEIVREICEWSGDPRPRPSRPGTPDSLNNPIPPWAERESYRITNDKERLALVYDSLVSFYRSYSKIREKDQGTGLYYSSWAAMDNSPRGGAENQSTWIIGIDTSAQVVSFARDLAFIARELGFKEDARIFEQEADDLSERINRHLWNEEDGFYYDLARDGRMLTVKTIAAFWPLLSGTASKMQAARLVEHLNNTNEFNRLHRVPTLSADALEFEPAGGYWRGAVWAPTTMAVVRGLERAGYNELARDIAANHLDHVAAVFEKTGTIWENYAPDFVDKGDPSRPDFVGWSGIGPILFLIEHVIGIKVDAPHNTIAWRINSVDRSGVENLWFGGKTVTLVCEKRANQNSPCRISVQSTGDFRLNVEVGNVTKELQISAEGKRRYIIEHGGGT